MTTNKNMGYIGIDVGSRAIKVAQVQLTSGGLQLIDAAIVNRQTHWAVDDPLNPWPPQSSLGEILAARSIAENLVGDQTAMSATMAICDIRAAHIELTDDDTINRTQITSRLDAIERFDVASRQFDYCPVPPLWRTQNTNVHVLSLTRDWAAAIGDDPSHCGLECHRLDGQPFVLARAAQLIPSASPGEPVLMIDWGYNRTMLCLAVDGAPVFIRMLRGCGFHFVLDAICESLGIQEFEASQLVQRYGVADSLASPSPVAREIEEAVQYSMSVFSHELDRTWDYLKRIHPDNLPRCAVLTGVGATTANITEWMASRSSLLFSTWGMSGDEDYGSASPATSCHSALLASAITLSASAFQIERVAV